MSDEQRCLWCDCVIAMMCRLNTGWCSEKCEEDHLDAVSTVRGFE